MANIKKITKNFNFTKIIINNNKEEYIIAKAKKSKILHVGKEHLSARWTFYYKKKKFTLINQKNKKIIHSVFLSNWEPEKLLVSEKIKNNNWKINFSYINNHEQDLLFNVQMEIVFNIKKMEACINISANY